MRRRREDLGLVAVALLALFGAPAAAQSPASAAGMAAELRELHRVDRLPLYRPGSRVAQISSYDTTGGNNDGFDGTYSSIRREGDGRVLAELSGPGVVHRIWTPTPTERMVAFYFDGEEAPRLRLPFIELFSGETPPFVRPVVGNEVGGYYSYLPLPYERSLKIVYEGDDIRFHQIQYRSYPEGTRVETFRTPLSPQASAELERVVDAWTRSGDRPWPAASARMTERAFTLEPGGSVELFRLDHGGRILGVEMERAPGSPPRGRDIVLEARWDGEPTPGILVPANDFFGYAFGEAAAQSLLLGSHEGRDYAYLPMPFDRSAVLSLRALASESGVTRGTARVFYTEERRDPDAEGKLYATWRREHPPAEGEPYLLLEARGRGHHVGTLLQAQGLEPGMTVFFEGDDVTTVDGEMRLHGTGSEDYFNGGWYALLDRWDRGMSLPLHGALDYSLPLSRTGGYRFYLADKVSFEEILRQTLEHGPEGNSTPVDYTSVAFHYGDAPPTASMDPAAAPPPPRSPAVHVFYPQLLEMSVGGGTSVAFVGGSLEVRAEPNGLVRFDVSELPPGRYRLRVSYRRGPSAPEFSVWRRQTQVSPWTDAWAQAEERVEGADMGEIELTAQARSVTLRTRAVEGRTSFRLDRLILEEVGTARAPAQPPARPAPDTAWVERTLSGMTLERKVAQLVTPDLQAGYLGEDDARLLRWIALARDTGVGMFVLYGGTPRDVAWLTNRLQREAAVPLIIAADFEGGPGQQVAGASEFPPNMALAAAGSEELMYRAAAAAATEGRAMGIHLTYTPVVDIAWSPDNPQEAGRSFGGDLELLGRMVRAYVRGYHDNGMLTTAKHFPGRGDQVPMPDRAPWMWNPKPAAELEAQELAAFRHGIEAGVDFVMSEHIAVPALAGGSDLPASVEARLATGVLRDRLGFQGILTTDDLWYDHVVARFGAEEVAVRAFEAGHDLILKPRDPVATVAALAAAVRSGRIPESRVDAAVRKLLTLKARLGLHRERTVDAEAVGARVGTAEHRALVQEIADRSLTLLRNDGVLPVTDPRRVVNVSIQKTDVDPGPPLLAARLAAAFPGARSFTVRPGQGPDARSEILDAARDADLVVVSLFVQRDRSGDAAPLRDTDVALVRDLVAAHPGRVVAMAYGNPYLVRKLPDVPAFLVGYGERGWYGNQDAYFESFIKALTGTLTPTGRLPVRVSDAHPIGSGQGR